MTILDALLDRTTRARTLEVALLARLLDDAGALDPFGPIELSLEAAFVANIIVEAESTASYGLLPSVRLAIRVERGNGHGPNATVYGRALRLARDVARLRVEDLVLIGRLPHVVALLRSVRRDEAAGCEWRRQAA